MAPAPQSAAPADALAIGRVPVRILSLGPRRDQTFDLP